MIRKICSLMAVVIAIASCSADRIIDEMNKSNQSLEDKIKENTERIAELESLCSRLNSNVSALQVILDAVHSEDWVKSVTPLKTDDGTVYGYILDFAKSGVLTIYNGKDGINGKDGYTPAIEIRQDTDGVYYWVIDGKWMTDANGQRIPARGSSGITPKLRITEGFWEISYDGGATWTQLGKATGNEGTSFFKDAKVTDNGLSLILSDGTSLTFPQYHKPEISFDVAENGTGAAAGIEVNINYQIHGQMSGTSITATSDGNYSVKVVRKNESSGVLTVAPPSQYTDGYINVIVSDSSGYSLLRVINFHENKINFPEGLEYNISQEGGTLNIPVSLNFDADIVLNSGWLTMEPKTRAEMRDSSIVVTTSKNESFGSRRALIHIYAKTNKYQPYSEIVVNQASASFSLSQSKFAVPYLESTVKAEVFSSVGLKVEVESGGEWLKAETRKNGNDYTITMQVSKNAGSEKRNGSVTLYSENDVKLGVIQVIQSSEISDSPDDMVFTVRANYPNDFTFWLTLDAAGSDYIDCYVDWGDGTVDYYYDRYTKKVRHKYDTETPTSYVVRISGKVGSLKSIRDVVEVNQWGKIGLRSVSFSGNCLLRKVAGCENGELASLQSASFKDCVNLQEIPDNLFSQCGGITSLSNAFENCQKLTTIPEGLFKDCTKLETISSIFDGCTSLKTIPKGLFKNCASLQTAYSAFNGCSALQNIGEGMFENCTNLYYVNSAFMNCSALQNIPEGLFENCPDLTDANRLFAQCYSLSDVPVNIFDHNRKLRDISYLFFGCRKLQCESPYTLIDGKKVHLYERNQYLDNFSFIRDYSQAFSSAIFLDYNRIPKEYK